MSANRLFIPYRPVLAPFEIRRMGGIPTVKERALYKAYKDKVQQEVKKYDYKLGVEVRIVIALYGQDPRPYNIFATANSVMYAVCGNEINTLTEVSISLLYVKDKKKAGTYIENRFTSLTRLGN